MYLDPKIWKKNLFVFFLFKITIELLLLLSSVVVIKHNKLQKTLQTNKQTKKLSKKKLKMLFTKIKIKIKINQAS